MTNSKSATLNITPIGIIHSQMQLKFDAPSQPDKNSPSQSIIELFPGKNFESAVKDLAGFERIWLIWWFHRNQNWRPMVLPPRGSEKRRGVFATRSPHRPNPIGITAVPLVKIDGLNIYIGSNDLIDGTPIIDIKPYLSSVDAFPSTKDGWVSELETQLSDAPIYEVKYSNLASIQKEFLEKQSVNFFPRAIELLTNNPKPHRTRRISKFGENGFRMSCGAWRIYFSVANYTVFIERLSPGYPFNLLVNDGYSDVPHRDAQLEFLKSWPE